MKKYLKIATFNFQNNYNLFLTKEDKIKCQSFVEFIKNNDIDILGTQEITIRKLKYIKTLLTEYQIYGSGRFGKLGKFFPISLANETNAVFFKDNFLSQETIKLSKAHFAFPRIITKIEFEDVVFLNTHLEHINNNIRKIQLCKIYDIIKQEKKKIILTGDFNMTIKSKTFQKFIADLEKLNLKKIEMDKPTCRKIKKGAIDHIFIDKSFEILKIETPNIKVSDHKPIIIKIKTK